MLAPSRTHRVHNKRIKSADVEGADCDGRCFPVDPHIPRMSSYSSEDLSRNEGAERTRWMQESRLTSTLPVAAVLADSVVESGITPPSSAAATRLLPSNPNFPFTAYLRIQKPGTFFALSAVVLTDVDRWEGPTYAWPPHFSAL